MHPIDRLQKDLEKLILDYYALIDNQASSNRVFPAEQRDFFLGRMSQLGAALSGLCASYALIRPDGN